MSLVSFSSARTVLLLSDGALFIYKASGRSVILVASVPWGAHDFEADVAKILKKDCGGRPVILLNDMVEQHYRKERVIKKGIGLLDRAGMVQRKLAFSFPNYPIRASLPLKEKKGENTEEVAAASDAFIFAAVPTSEAFESVMGAVKIALVTVAGFGLLPVESAGMVAQISAKLESKNKEKSKWTAFVGQNRGGGLRQIVIKDGQIAMTRITPIAEAEENPSEWAQEVFREFSSTMSYVTRFGYQPEDGLNVIVVAEGAAAAAIEPLLQENYNAHVLGTQEAGDILKLGLGKQERRSFSTSLHVAWIARKAKLTLPMQAQALSDVSHPRKVAGVSIGILILLALGMAYFLVTTAIDLTQSKTDISDNQDRLARLQADYEIEVEKKEALGFDIKLVQSSIKVYNELNKEKISVLPLMGRIGRALGGDMRIDQVSISEIDSVSLDQLRRTVTDPNQPPFVFQATMQVTYPPDADVAQSNLEVEGFRQRLQILLPGHVVELTKQIEDFEYVEEITVESGAIEDEEEQDLIVELVVRGPAS